MRTYEDTKPSKSDKSSPPVDHNNVHVYPDWAAMQAYYGPRVTLPSYYNSAVAAGHAPPPYMWPPQHVMAPYGAPYAAIYSPGGVYAHPAVPIGSHQHGHGMPSSPLAVTPLSVETPTKSTGNADGGLMKKLKKFDGLAMSIGNGNADGADHGAEQQLSPSVGTEGSSDGSDGNTSGDEVDRQDQTKRKRSREGTPTVGGDGKTETLRSLVSAGDMKAASSKGLTTVVPASVAGKVIGPGLSPGIPTALELKNSPTLDAKASPTNVPQQCVVVPPEAWLQNERELKRERRKQSNRESARRSRLRKQAETEELARRVDTLTSDNVALKSEINQLTEKSEKLKQENATLMEKLKNAQQGRTQEITLNNVDDERAPSDSTENLLSRVNNSGSIDRSAEEEGDMYEKNSNANAKLHQLLDTSPRADAVAAG